MNINIIHKAEYNQALWKGLHKIPWEDRKVKWGSFMTEDVEDIFKEELLFGWGPQQCIEMGIRAFQTKRNLCAKGAR